MIYFALTRMWLYHGKINEKLFVKFTDTLKVKGQSFLDHPVVFANDNHISGRLHASWRDFSEEQEEGHDLYPCIDMVPDKITLGNIEKLFLIETSDCRLFDCCFRITDYGYLNVILIFQADNFEGLRKLMRLQANITRKINDWIPSLDPILEELSRLGYVNFSDEYFGIPLKIKDYLSIDHTDMYTYQDITILSSENQLMAGEIRELYTINDEPEKIERFTIHGIDQSPIICLEKVPDKQSLYDLMEPYSLLLAETNTYDAISGLNYAIIKMMNHTDLENQSRPWFKRKSRMVSAFESFSPSDLRRITINTHYILHCINTRKSAILPWQNLFLRRFKEKNSYDENKENFERSEEIISRLIEEKSQEMQKSHSKMLEVLFLFLSAITIYSTYVDIASFLDTKHNNFSNINSNTLEIKLFISITIILGLVFAYVLKVKRKG